MELEDYMETKSTRQGKKLGVGRKLNTEQEAEIFRLISTRRPFQLGFKLLSKRGKPYLWSRDLLMQLIEQRLHIKLSDGGVVNYLNRWGFPPLKREKKIQDQCHKDIREWLKLNYESILDRIKTEAAQCYWMGDIALVGLLSIEADRQKRLTMIPVISHQGRVYWLTIKGQFTPDRQIMLLKSLVGQSSAKVFLIRNTLNIFTTKPVADWLADNISKIEIFPPSEWTPA